MFQGIIPRETWRLPIVRFLQGLDSGRLADVRGPFSIISVIDQVFGKFTGDVTVICVLAFFIVLTALLNSICVRFLLIGAIYRRHPALAAYASLVKVREASRVSSMCGPVTVT